MTEIFGLSNEKKGHPFYEVSANNQNIGVILREQERI
jgi:hypothetical protein